MRLAFAFDLNREHFQVKGGVIAFSAEKGARKVEGTYDPACNRVGYNKSLISGPGATTLVSSQDRGFGDAVTALSLVQNLVEWVVGSPLPARVSLEE